MGRSIGKRTRLDKEVKKTKKQLKTKRNIFKKFLIFILLLGTICCYSGLFLLYGPYSGFRDWYITTAMMTMSHKYLATWFYDEVTIEDCMYRNNIIEVLGTTDTSKIHFSVDDNKGPFENKYEEQVLKRSDKNNDYKIIRLQESRYTGYLVVIYDPSRVKTAVSSKIGSSGEYISEISKKNKSLVAINAGGFEDDNYSGSGGAPIGVTISSRKCYKWKRI